MKNEQIELTPEIIQRAANILVIAMIQTNAETLEVTLEKFHGPDKKVYGDFKIEAYKLPEAKTA